MPKGSPAIADLALLRAFRAWGGPDFEAASSRFAGAWRGRLRSVWPRVEGNSPGEAWSDLRRDHEASSRPDPSRVHPSWYSRALRSESPAVQLSVLAGSSPRRRRELCGGLAIDDEEFEPDHPPDPEALAWALALWTERLVGDVPSLDDDPPVVVAMTRLGLAGLARLVKVCGLAKHAFAVRGMSPAGSAGGLARFTTVDRVRFAFFRRQVGVPDPRLVPVARGDLGAIGGDRRRGHARLGLRTFGRLLGQVEPHRARWASQHLPYAIAREMREEETPGLPRKALLAWESWVLEAAWARLLAEGRLSGGRGARAALGPGARP